MRRRPWLTTFLIITAALIAFGLFVDRRADLREAGIEARFPPEGEIVIVDGREVHVLVRGVTGPDLVLIHGAGSNVRDMTSSIVDDLATRYRVFVVDRPGHGWTDVAPDYKGAFKNEGESPQSQARLLSRAVAQLGVDRPLVMGHSFGGAVAMAWAMEAEVAGLAIISGVTLPWPGEINISYRVLGSPLGGALLAPIGAAFVPNSYVEDVLVSTFAPQPVPQDYVQRSGVPLAVRTHSLRANNRQVKGLRANAVEQSAHYEAITAPIEMPAHQELAFFYASAVRRSACGKLHVTFRLGCREYRAVATWH